MSTDLPPWVYDTVMALQKWADEHPKLFMERYDGQFLKLDDDCGCKALAAVPAEVQAEARVLAHYLANKPSTADCTCWDTSILGSAEPIREINPRCLIHGKEAAA